MRTCIEHHDYATSCIQCQEDMAKQISELEELKRLLLEHLSAKEELLASYRIGKEIALAENEQLKGLIREADRIIDYDINHWVVQRERINILLKWRTKCEKNGVEL